MANNIKKIRESLGMSQQQLADAISSSKPYISDLETGKRDISRIQVPTMQRLCKALNSTPEEVCGVTYEFSDDDRLIIDGVWTLPSTGEYFVKIINLYYRLPSIAHNLTGHKLADKMIYFPTGSMYATKDNECTDYLAVYTFNKITPRDISFYTESRPRPAAAEELEAGMKKFGITQKTEPFDEINGSIFGLAFRQTITSVQLVIPNGVNPVTVESWFRDQGIDAGNVSPTRVNVRVK